MANTVVGSGITIDGEISGDDTVTVEGTVKGHVNVEQVVVAADGLVDATVEVRQIEIFGQLLGNVTAQDRVDIRSGGKVTGDLKAPRIQIAEGARFKGNIDME